MRHRSCKRYLIILAILFGYMQYQLVVHYRRSASSPAALKLVANYERKVAEFKEEHEEKPPKEHEEKSPGDPVSSIVLEKEVEMMNKKSLYYLHPRKPQSLGNETHTFGPYTGEFFEHLCRRSIREPKYFGHLTECSTLKSRPLTPLELSGGDILFTVRTAVKYHAARLPELFESWMSYVDPQNVYIMSDGKDPELENWLAKVGMKYVVSHVSNKTHAREDLCYKSGAGMEVLLWPENLKYKWMCHVDDDIYINMESLVRMLSHFDPNDRAYVGRGFTFRVQRHSKIGKPGTPFAFAVGGSYCISRPMLEAAKQYIVGPEALRDSCVKTDYPDDITIGLVVEHLLNERLSRTSMMYMHDFMVGLQVEPKDYKHQIAFAFGDGSVKYTDSPNVIKVPNNLFNMTEDVSQFRSLHCYLHPDLQWCLEKKTRNQRPN